MALLFADTTYNITLGVLSDEFEWLELRSHNGQRASAVLQNEVYEACQKVGVKAKDLKAVIYCAGPGFYTGLRLSEGFSDIFKLFNIPTFSFYSYELPNLNGAEKGVWVTKAYRGEYFFHHWDKLSSVNELVSSNDFNSYLEKFEDIYIHSSSAIDKELHQPRSTLDILKEKPFLLKKIVDQKIERESFYFRAPEDEFKVSM